MSAASFLIAAALLPGQLSGKALDRPDGLFASRAQILKHLEGLSTGDPVRYANEVKIYGEQLTRRELAPHLVRLVLSDNPRVRRFARWRLWEERRDGELAVAMAYVITGDLCAGHFEWLAGQVQTDHAYARCFVRRLCNHDVARIRIAAWDAIGRTEEDLRDEIPLLMDVIETDPDVAVRTAMVRLLGRLGPCAKPAAAGLLAVLESQEALRLRLAAAKSLMQIECDNQPFVRRIEEIAASVRVQISDAELQRIVSGLGSLIAAQEELTWQTSRAHRKAILGTLLGE
jgi:hypothetical protein